MDSPIDRLPTLASVVGASWWQMNPDWFSAPGMPQVPWYVRCDRDLAGLAKMLSLEQLIAAYRAMLRDRDGFVAGVYEVHGAALLAARASQAQLHVPRGDGGGRNFDVRATIAGYAVNADAKTRDDRWPFNLPRQDEADGIRGFFGERASVDPRDAQQLGMPTATRTSRESDWKPIPESTVVVDVLANALRQLPIDGINVVLLGQVQGDREHLERALGGVEICDFVTDRRTRTSWAEWRRLPTGIFGTGPKAEAFIGLSAILWMRLSCVGDDLYRTYRLYENPTARCPLPAPVRTAFAATMQEWTLLPPEPLPHSAP